MNKSIIAATVLALMASTANAGIVPSGESLLPPALGSEPTSSWTNKVETNAMTDTKDVFLSVRSQSYPDQYGGTKTAKLTIRCMDNTTVASLYTGMHMTDHRGYGVITYRVDDQKSRKVNAQDSTDNKHLGLWSGRRSIPFVKTLFGGDKLLIEVTPYSQNVLSLNFDISGLESEITELRESCHW